MNLQTIFKTKMDRRRLFGNLGLLGAGAALGACTTSELVAQPPVGSSNVDVEILNFALNLEYLEAEYYLRGVLGRGLDVGDIGANPGEVTGGRLLNFAGMKNFQNAEEIALDEEAHVKFIRQELGDLAVDRPAINFTDAFEAAGVAAGLGPGFDPFADDISFILGAFIFEDVGVTAYNGAAPLITDPENIRYAASILAVEAYHAGDIRNVIFNRGGAILEAANAISDLRGAVGGGKDQRVTNDGPFNTAANITPTDADGLAFGRTPREVLNIVYLDATGEATSGGFFPNGLSGDFSALL